MFGLSVLLTAAVTAFASPITHSEQISCTLKCDGLESPAECACVCESALGPFDAPFSHCAVDNFDVLQQPTIGIAQVPLDMGQRRVGIQQTGGVVSGSLAVPNSNNIWDGIGPGTDAYQFYSGDGESGWPDTSQWISFIDMFNNYNNFMEHSCGWNNWGPDASGPEIGDLWNSIQIVANETLVDHRFILAIIMQESKGCVRVPTTHSPAPDFVRNPGLMQDHNGAATCNENGQASQSMNPCPAAVILQMVRDGTAGTNDGDGLAQSINEAGASDTSACYKAARLYNSGSIDPSGDLGGGVACHCYASDIANRLTGWVNAGTQCYLDPVPC